MLLFLGNANVGSLPYKHGVQICALRIQIRYHATDVVNQLKHTVVSFGIWYSKFTDLRCN